MPSPIDRRGRLVPEQEWEDQKEAERAARLARFTRGMGGRMPAPGSREVIPLDQDEPDWEPPSPRPHDPHTLEALRMGLVAANNWSTE